MKLKDVVRIVNGQLLCHEDHLEKEVKHGFSSDLMSDVLTILEDDVLLITGLATNQVIRTAEMSDISNILIVRDKTPSKAMIEMAQELDIAIIATKYSSYRASALLFQEGLPPVY
ncbi:MAG: DRTGG domain-containing protein [Spirochaetia bacterium]|jgi:predicted transcriptional regulator|nr:DRTGG domain-containing protein [Spirochaetia bacterium]